MDPVRLDPFQNIVNVHWNDKINVGVLSVLFPSAPADSAFGMSGMDGLLLAITSAWADEVFVPENEFVAYAAVYGSNPNVSYYPHSEAVWQTYQTIGHGMERFRLRDIRPYLILATVSNYNTAVFGDGHNREIMANDFDRTQGSAGSVNGLTTQEVINLPNSEFGDPHYSFLSEPKPPRHYFRGVRNDGALIAIIARIEKEKVDEQGSGSWKWTDISASMIRWTYTWDTSEVLPGFGRTGGALNFYFNLTRLRKDLGPGAITKDFKLKAANNKNSEAFSWQFKAFLNVNPNDWSMHSTEGVLTFASDIPAYETSGSITIPVTSGEGDVATGQLVLQAAGGITFSLGA